jgi:hypothetical protein
MSILFSNQQEILQAQGTLDRIQDAISALTLGGSTFSLQLVYSPAGWWLIGFDKESKTQVGMLGREVKPSEKCKDKICLCICKNSADCTQKSACMEIDKPFVIDNANLAVRINLLNLNITNKERAYGVEIVKND